MISSVTKAIILAGGLGTRLRSIMPDLPKPMAPIRGRPFLAHQMDYWINQGIEHFVLSVGYKKELIVDYFGVSYKDASIDYAIEETPLGTGGGLMLAANGVCEPVLILNGDTFFEVPLDNLVRFHAEHESEWTFSLFRPDEAGRYMAVGVTLDDEIVSLKSGRGKRGGLANGGVYIIDPSVLNKTSYCLGQKASLEEDLVSEFLKRGVRLYGFECSGDFIDIGVPEDYYRAADILPNERD